MPTGQEWASGSVGKPDNDQSLPGHTDRQGNDHRLTWRHSGLCLVRKGCTLFRGYSIAPPSERSDRSQFDPGWVLSLLGMLSRRTHQVRGSFHQDTAFQEQLPVAALN